MRKETDLARVKMIAHVLLDMPIAETSFSQAIVSHPFTSTGVTAAQNEDGNITVVDLLNNKEDYGRELAVRDGVIPKSGLLAECFDCRAYAEAYMNQHGLSATDHGYVAWNGGEIFYEYSQPEQSNSPSMSM